MEQTQEDKEKLLKSLIIELSQLQSEAETARIKSIDEENKRKELESLKKQLYHINNKDKIQQYKKELYQKNKEKIKVQRKEKLSSMTPTEIDDLRWKRQRYYQLNKELILDRYHSTWKERRSLKQQGIKDTVVCKECNKEYLRSNLARHVSKIHPWIINYKEGH